MPDSTALSMPVVTGPAISATSDTPISARSGPALSAVGGQGKADVALSNAKPADKSKDEDAKLDAESGESKEKVEKEAKTVSETPEKKDEEDLEEAERKKSNEDKTPAWMKAEVTKERNRRRAAEEAANASAARLETALKALEKLGNADSKVKQDDAEDPRPKREKFDDPDAYESALIDWTARTTTRSVTAKAEQERVAAETRAENERKQAEDLKEAEKLKSSWEKSRKAAIEKYDDYEAVAENDDVQISQAMAHAIVNSEIGTEVAYYLGKNPDEAERISKLTPNRQLMAIGRIEASLEVEMAKEKREVTRAPRPHRPTGSRSTAAEKDLTEMSMEEYAAKRNTQLRGSRVT